MTNEVATRRPGQCDREESLSWLWGPIAAAATATGGQAGSAEDSHSSKDLNGMKGGSVSRERSVSVSLKICEQTRGLDRGEDLGRAYIALRGL